MKVYFYIIILYWIYSYSIPLLFDYYVSFNLCDYLYYSEGHLFLIQCFGWLRLQKEVIFFWIILSLKTIICFFLAHIDFDFFFKFCFILFFSDCQRRVMFFYKCMSIFLLRSVARPVKRIFTLKWGVIRLVLFVAVT